MKDPVCRSFHSFLFGKIPRDLRRNVAKRPMGEAITAKPIGFPTGRTTVFLFQEFCVSLRNQILSEKG